MFRFIRSAPESGRGDTRMTTRYDEHDMVGCVLRRAARSRPRFVRPGPGRKALGPAARQSAVSLGIHESQSRMWENFVGRSRSFWKFMMPKARAAFD